MSIWRRTLVGLLGVLLTASVAGCGRDSHGVEFTEESGTRCGDLVALALASPSSVAGAIDCISPAYRGQLAALGVASAGDLHRLEPGGAADGRLTYVRFIGPACPLPDASGVLATPGPDQCPLSLAYWFSYEHALRIVALDLDRAGLVDRVRSIPCRPLWC